MCDITKSIDLLYELQKLNSNHYLFKNDIIEYIIHSKWNDYGYKYFLLQLIFHLSLFIIFLSNYVWIFPYRLNDDNYLTLSKIIITLNMFFLLIKIVYEVYHYLTFLIINYDKNYNVPYLNIWNKIDLVLILMNFTTLCLDISYLENNNSKLIEVI